MSTLEALHCFVCVQSLVSAVDVFMVSHTSQCPVCHYLGQYCAEAVRLERLLWNIVLPPPATK